MSNRRPQASKSKKALYKKNNRIRKKLSEKRYNITPDATRSDRGFHVNIGDVLLINLEGEGSVQRGMRPCVVVHRNESRNLLTVVPLTKKKKEKYKNQIMIIDRALKCPSYALCDNQQTVDKIQVVAKWGKVDKQNYERIVQQIQMIMLNSLNTRKGYNKPFKFE